jgi:hypothetical protein
MFMIMEVNKSFSLEKKAKADQQNPKVQAWEQLMWRFQQALPEAEPDEKWLRMERIFKLEPWLTRRIRVALREHNIETYPTRRSWQRTAGNPPRRRLLSGCLGLRVRLRPFILCARWHACSSRLA